MPEQPNVTVLGVTRNVRDVVRLTYASFRHYTPEPCTVLVADNGSTDGTLEDLCALDWLTVYSLEERRSLLRAAEVEAERAWSALGARLDAYAGQLSPGEQQALSRLRAMTPSLPLCEDETALTRHDVALDWLAPRVETPFFLLLDSDVEFLERGWLSEMLELMERENLVALGEYEPGRHPCRQRLATYVLLLRTDALRVLGVPFHSFLRIADPEEARRWQSEPHGGVLDSTVFAGYRSAAFYDTGAAIFERIQETGGSWANLPPAVARKLRHLGHMTWALDAPDGYEGVDELRAQHASSLTYARERLRLYRWPP